jgi:hypothetical protein
MTDVFCGECRSGARLTTGEEIYPHRPDLFDKMFWKCDNCGTYCGCHRNTDRPFGSPANAATRMERSRVHQEFDQMWRQNDMPGARALAYKWLSDALDLPPEQTHIGMFDLKTCRAALAAVRARVTTEGK